jgi:methyl-accepting chemotaxis protein
MIHTEPANGEKFGNDCKGGLNAGGRTRTADLRIMRRRAIQEQSQAQTKQVIRLGLEVAVAAVAFGLGMAFWISGTITRPVERAVQVFHKIGQGDLTQRLNVSSGDEIGQMARTMNRTLDSLLAESIERKRVEEELRRAKLAAEEASRVSDHFIYNLRALLGLRAAAPGWVDVTPRTAACSGLIEQSLVFVEPPPVADLSNDRRA